MREAKGVRKAPGSTIKVLILKAAISAARDSWAASMANLEAA